MKETSADLIIVGAGAAGLVTAIWAGRSARGKGALLKILLLDRRPEIGAKILMSGGTRCNVTHQKVTPADYCGGPPHFIKHLFESFTPRETIEFFKEIGVELVLEPGGKFFPATHSARTVLEALKKETARVGVTLKTGIKITGIEGKEDGFDLQEEKGAPLFSARRVVLATGGLSYPATGSDGTGYRIAESFGHTLIDPFPALTPLLAEDPDWKKLSGVSMEGKLSCFKKGRKTAEREGPFLFTHFGFSGPAALDLSRHFASAGRGEKPELVINFLPRQDEKSLTLALQGLSGKNPRRLIKNVLTEEFFLPLRFVETFLAKTGIDPTVTLARISGEERKRLVRRLLHYPVEIQGVFGYPKAEVTAGGVDLREINVSTLESKLRKGLYFAGEILNVDGRIGGFNFQWAWTSGAVAGRSAAESLS